MIDEGQTTAVRRPRTEADEILEVVIGSWGSVLVLAVAFLIGLAAHVDGGWSSNVTAML